MVKFHFTHIRVIAWPPFQKTSLLTKDDKHLSISGRYFAKPQIKEYEFEPKHELLELVEGQTGQVKEHTIMTSPKFGHFLTTLKNYKITFQFPNT